MNREEIERWRGILTCFYVGDADGMKAVNALCDRALASLRDGWVSVPLIPTHKMIAAGAVNLGRASDSGVFEARGRAVSAYVSMLAAREE